MPADSNKKAPYGFLAAQDLPETDIFDERILPDAKTMRFATTGDYSQIAKNHCGAVCASNVLLCLGGGTDLHRAPASAKGTLSAEDLPEQSEQSLLRNRVFSIMHRLMGNGPVFTLNGSIKKGARDLGFLILSERASSRPDIIRSIDNGKPVALMLANGIFDWHWVLCVGYRRYPLAYGGKTYLRLANSWSPEADVFYVPGEGARILSGRAYYTVQPD